MGKTVLTFGEIMMRLSPKDHLRIEQATEFDVRYGGAEANTALSLAYQGDKAATSPLSRPTVWASARCAR